jgi:hypothetical protein
MTSNIKATWGAGNGLQSLLGNLLYLGNRDGLDRDYAGLVDDLQIYNWNLSEEDAAYLFSHPGETLFTTPTPVPGDANDDGKVDALDAQRLAANWGKDDANWSMGDFNGDFMVNVEDAAILAANWGSGVREATPAPEPGVMAPLGAAILAFVARRRRRAAAC